MNPLKCLLTLIVTLVFLNACSSDSGGAPTVVYSPPTELVDKSGSAQTEDDLQIPSARVFDADHNTVVFLSDYYADAASSGVDLGGAMGQDTVPMQIDTEGDYRFCTVLDEEAAGLMQVAVYDQADRQLLEHVQSACTSLALSAATYAVVITRTPQDELGDDIPVFLTFEGDTIAVKANSCQYCDLAGIDFTGRRLVETDFTGADLGQAIFDEADLFSTVFTGANTDYASFADTLIVSPVDMRPPATNATPGDRRKGRELYANVLGVSNGFAAGVGIKHTYPVVIGSQQGGRFAWGAFGTSQGGSELSGTRTECGAGEDCIDLETVNFIMTEAPCAWPKKPMYATVGVCWNITNRALYYTNKTVSEVDYYTAVETFFGTYGLTSNSTCVWAPWETDCEKGRRLYSWNKCLEAVEANHPWQGWDYLGASSAAAAGSRSSADRNPRIALYHAYQETASATGRSAATADGPRSMSELAYLQELLKLNVSETIGEIDAGLMAALLDAHSRMYHDLKAIDDTVGDYSEQFNRIMNDTLLEYESILGANAYSRLMRIDPEQGRTFDLDAYQ